ncbi:M28 family peptidase [Pseudenhygromyxa sp. WMMC2535]|uniref:M28 family peptidase n=1 Tax=Pseudenhygromyxa sp. WMMC2535 TaxID=2712867 RepID=UPI0015552219|nr:M28 family peptidase [Pseudenhygromyxa sp. WMMC2535]NVB38980.1 M28 family peptidase [Pseudenhygromyxa sp. WMMC2535]
MSPARTLGRSPFIAPLVSLIPLACLGLGACHRAESRAPAADDAPESRASASDAPKLDVAFLRDFTAAFSADELAGRLPGSEGGELAVAQLISTMAAIGLEPAGEDGGWTQRVTMRGVTLDREASKLELVPTKGPSKGEAEGFVFGEDWVGTSFAAGGEHLVDAELVFLGYGVTAPEYQWDDYAGADVKGKIAVVFVGDPPTEDGSFGGPAMTYYGRWTYKYERALAAGAAGCLVIHEDEPASYGWNVPQTSYSSERFHVLDGQGQPPAAMNLRGWISAEAADALAQRGGKSLAQWHEMAMRNVFQPVQVGAKLSGALITSERSVADVNVLGRLPGTTQPERAVFLAAHWDHLGSDPEKIAAGEDGIYNGAVDNASGVATMLGVAAQLAEDRRTGAAGLERSVVFLATTAEEQGLLGSRYWVNNPTMPLDDVVAVVNLDSMNVHGATRAVEVVGWGQTTLEDRLIPLAANQQRRVVPDTHPEAGSFYRSDHFPFAQVGIPALYFHSSLDMVDGGVEAGEAILAGVRERYHTPADAFDPAWSFEGALQDALLVVALVRELAGSDADPAYKPSSEFAGKR